ncbi:hypothetical protein D9M68_526930 [compost metagenome]
MDFITTAYDKAVARDAFDCGKHPALNTYIAKQATQDEKRNVSKTFLYLEDGALAGYYTLASTSILLTDVTAELAKGLPRYPLPAVLLSRLAVEKGQQGKGLGKRLIADVFRRVYAVSKHVGVAFLAVDAKDADAAIYYDNLGFTASPVNPLRLVLPTGTFIPTLKAQEET